MASAIACIALVLALGVLAALASRRRSAGPYEDALAHFAADSFDETDEGINGGRRQRQSAAPRRSSPPCRTGGCCSAPRASASSFASQPDRLIDAATGQPVAGAAPADLEPVRLNNRLRRIVEAALGGLTLLSPDPAKRLEAAQAVFKSQGCRTRSPALDQAIAKETDARSSRR